MQRRSGSKVRGVALIEALVALVVMALGMLAVAGIQATMRLNADVARQRTEANRLAQAEMETMRGFLVMDVTAGRLAWDDLVGSQAAPVDIPAANTVFNLTREVGTANEPALKTMRVTVTWADRTGQQQVVVLNSVIAGAEPGLSGLLSVPPAATSIDRPGGRQVSIPVAAKDLGNGTSGFIPAQGAAVAWVFNNTTGVITSVCTVLSGTTNELLTAGDLQSCSSTTAQLLAGVVRFNLFNGAAALSAADSENPPGPPLNLAVLLSLSSTGHASGPACFDNAPPTRLLADTMISASYFCIIFPNGASTWSGITTIVPAAFSDTGLNWTVNTGGSHRVCRYTTAGATDVAVANANHPATYTNVKGNLVNQNFLVIVSTKSCPTDVAANPAIGDFVNSNTLQHQP